MRTNPLEAAGSVKPENGAVDAAFACPELLLAPGPPHQFALETPWRVSNNGEASNASCGPRFARERRVKLMSNPPTPD
jgi:hypothetical protein